MNYQSRDKENMNLMDRDSDGLMSTERRVLETFKVFEDKHQDATPEALATLVLAEKTNSLSVIVHKLNQQLTEINNNVEDLNKILDQFEKLNRDDLKQKRPSGRSCLLRYIVYVRTIFEFCDLIEKIIEVVQYFM